MSDRLKMESQRKDEFLAMLAHELRNPLVPISTAAQILMPRVSPERIVQASDVIARQVRHMTELVDDLLDVSRVTRGLVELQRVPVDVKSVASSAIEQARPLIEGRRHALTTHIASSPALVLGDRKRLVQVMVNLPRAASGWAWHWSRAWSGCTAGGSRRAATGRVAAAASAPSCRAPPNRCRRRWMRMPGWVRSARRRCGSCRRR